MNTTIGHIHGEPHDDGTLTLAYVAGGEARTLIDTVANYIAKNPGLRTSDVAKSITGGDKEARSRAIIDAEKKGLIVRVKGESGAKICYPPGHADNSDNPTPNNP